MSLIKAVKWFAIYILLTLGLAAAIALGTFIFNPAEFGTLFFFLLFLTGLFLVAVGALIILRAPRLTWADMGDWPAEAYRRSHAVRGERKEGVLLILVGLTLILVSLTQF